MKTTLTLLIALLISISSFAQTGFNYKALIKNDLGNVVSNQDIHIRFTIQTLVGPNFIPTYQERHNAMTDANGIVIVTIGEGDVIIAGTFPDGFWFPNISLHVEIDIERDGTYVDLGETSFKKVPMAIAADNVFSGNYNDLTNQPTITTPGLIRINEQGGPFDSGYVLNGRVSSSYGPLGSRAVDLSYGGSTSNSTTRGATGSFSLAMGIFTTASGFYSTAMGHNTTASGISSTAMGEDTTASGLYSTAIGHNTTAPSYAETVIGSNSTNYTPESTNAWDFDDRIFVIGNGRFSSAPSDALTVLKNGTITASSFDIAEINSAGDKALITKEYADSNYLATSGNNVVLDGEIQHTSTGTANMIPIAYGIVDSNGNVLSGTGNFTAFLSGNVFVVDVNGTQSLSYSNSVCLITPISSASRTSSIIIADGNGDNDADLNVRIFNTSGAQVTTTFQFVIYKL